MGIVAGFKTSDGTFFEKEIDADEYEQDLLRKNKLEYLFSKKLNNSACNWYREITIFIIKNKKDIMQILGE